jgi:hypothetical protein
VADSLASAANHQATTITTSSSSLFEAQEKSELGLVKLVVTISR